MAGFEESKKDNLAHKPYVNTYDPSQIQRTRKRKSKKKKKKKKKKNSVSPFLLEKKIKKQNMDPKKQFLGTVYPPILLSILYIW
ncbi:conserved hypothetical protein [Ricinus communis]|uniref:Uncharacterized protein n=1 Tax=Ricinus communis TaxID=3988 RepID=B9T0W7_RICCO|nr:conserved hypothetical protein [Ricinus communis]